QAARIRGILFRVMLTAALGFLGNVLAEFSLLERDTRFAVLGGLGRGFEIAAKLRGAVEVESQEPLPLRELSIVRWHWPSSHPAPCECSPGRPAVSWVC